MRDFLFSIFIFVSAAVLAIFPALCYAQTGTIGVNGDGISLCGITQLDGSELIAFVNSVTGELKTAENSSGSWKTQVVATGFPAASSLGISNSGEVNLFALNPATAKLVRFSKSGTSWSAPSIISSNAAGKISVASTNSDVIVSFAELNFKRLFVSSKNNSWALVAVDNSSDDVAKESSIAVSPSGRVAIAYSNSTSHTLKVATSSNSVNWTIETLDYPHFIEKLPSVKWGADESLHVLAGDTLQNPAIGGLGITHFQKSLGQSWQIEQIGFPISSASSGKLISVDNKVMALAITKSGGIASLFAATREANGIWGGGTLSSSSSEFYSDLVALPGASKTDYFLTYSSPSETGIRFFNSLASSVQPSPVIPTPTPTASPVQTATPTASPSASATPVATSLRINAGGSAYTDSSGQPWKADSYFVGGDVYSTASMIAGTVNDNIYRSERYGKTFSYKIPLSNGSYQVTLNFAEIFFDSMGQRVFDVDIEGSRVATSLDIWLRAGKNNAYDLIIPVSIKDGELNIVLNSRIENAKLSGIEIKSLSTVTATPTTAPTAIPTASPAPVPTAIMDTMGLKKLCEPQIAKNGLSSFMSVKNLSAAVTPVRVNLKLQSGSTLQTFVSNLSSNITLTGELKSPLTVSVDSLGLECSIMLMSQGWQTAAQTLAKRSARLGPQDVVFEPISGVGPTSGLFSDSKLALVNISTMSVNGNLTIMDRFGAVKNIVRTTLQPSSLNIFNAATLGLGTSGSIEWRPDLNFFAVYMTFEQKLERNESGLILVDKLVRTDGVQTSPDTTLSRALTSQILVSARQSLQALNVEVKVEAAPLF